MDTGRSTPVIEMKVLRATPFSEIPEPQCLIWGEGLRRHAHPCAPPRFLLLLYKPNGVMRSRHSFDECLWSRLGPASGPASTFSNRLWSRLWSRHCFYECSWSRLRSRLHVFQWIVAPPRSRLCPRHSFYECSWSRLGPTAVPPPCFPVDRGPASVPPLVPL